MSSHPLSQPAPEVVDRAAHLRALHAITALEKAHSRQGDAIAAARRRLPMTEVDASLPVTGPEGEVSLLDVFEGRTQLLAYYAMWHEGMPAAHQCEGCTWCIGQVSGLPYLHSRGITFAVLAQGPYEESARYRDFMGWTMPWYSAFPSRERLLEGKALGMMQLVSYLRVGDAVYETYSTTRRGVEVMDSVRHLMDLTPYGRQEAWEDSPAGWPQPWTDETLVLSVDGRPIPQWERLRAGFDDALRG